MRHVSKYARKTCGRWKVVRGRRKICTYPKRHDGECEPDKKLREAAKLDELTRLLIEHDDVECDGCAAAERAAVNQCDPGHVVALRCDWARGLVRALHAGHGTVMPEPPDDEGDGSC